MSDETILTDSVEDVDSRPPTNWLTYNNDCRTILGDGPKGPTTLNEMWFPVVASYNPATNKTRVGFTLMPPRSFLEGFRNGR